MKVGFVGFGKMGSALAEGALLAGVLRKRDVFVYDTDVQVRQRTRRSGFTFVPSVGDLLNQAALIFLAVKPQQMKDVVSQLNRTPNLLDMKCFVSIAAGLSLDWFQKAFGRKLPILRVMPNTPALVRQGMSVVCANPKVSKKQFAWVTKILRSVGEVNVMAEKKMDVVTAVSGSGPAYFFYFAEAMIDAASRMGLKLPEADHLVRQTMLGAAQLLKESSLRPEALRTQVTSPGGTTEAAIKTLSRKGQKNLIYQAILEASKRSKELRQQFS